MINIATLLDESLCEENAIHSLIMRVIASINTEVIYNGGVVRLSWQHVEAHLNTRKSEFPDRFNSLYAHIAVVFAQLSSGKVLTADGLVRMEFKEPQTVVAFFNFLSQILPIIEGEYPQCNDNAIILSADQSYFFDSFTMQETGKVSQSCLGDHYLMKTLRADKYDFSHAFTLGIIPGEKQARRQNLRPIARQAYTISSEGNVTSRVNKLPRYTAEEKRGFSQIQSTTFIDKETTSPAFGFGKSRTEKLYGLMTHVDDALISRMLTQDSGTVAHVFDHPNHRSAKASHLAKNKSGNDTFFTPNEIDLFKIYNLKSKRVGHQTNEVMARLRFNPYKSMVCICSDTLEARLLACHYAQECLEEFSVYAKRNNITLNPRFKIPIIFYRPLLQDHQFYTHEMRLDDQAEASKIYHDVTLRAAKYDCDDYEFLLALPENTVDLLQKVESTGAPLALHMIKKGCVRMLLRLLGTSRETVFDRLLRQGYVYQNDPLIAELICAEAFDIASKLIDATKSDKYTLKLGGVYLRDHLIERGNPRQLFFIGFDRILEEAAQGKAWVAIKLCIKEYPDTGKVLLGKLLYLACRQGQHKEADFLLERGADRVVKYEIITSPGHYGYNVSLELASRNKDWLMMAIFAQYPTDEEDVSGYGYALFIALRHQQWGLAKLLMAAGAKPSWHAFNCHDCHRLDSTLFAAVDYDYSELLEPLIAHELHGDASSFAIRCRLAHDFACFKKNAEAATMLEKFVVPLALVEDQEVKTSICVLFLEALAVSDMHFAKYRLLKYLNHYQLFSEERFHLINAIRIIFDSIGAAIELIPRSIREGVLSTLAETLMPCQEIPFLLALCDLRKTHGFIFDGEIYSVVIRNLQINNFNLVKKLKSEDEKTEHREEYWQRALKEGLYLAIRSNDAEKLAMLYQLGVEIAPRDIENAAGWGGRDAKLLLLLDAVRSDNYQNIAFRYAFFMAWVVALDDRRVAEKLVRILGPSLIKHFTLVYIMHAFAASRPGFYSYPEWEHLSCHLNWAKMEDGQIYYCPRFEGDPVRVFPEISTILNDYFEDTTSPFRSELKIELIDSCYEKAFFHFQSIVQKESMKFRFTFWRKPGFVKQLNDTLKMVDQLLGQNSIVSIERKLSSNVLQKNCPKLIVSF
jgi:hypothetical protein